MDRLTEEEYGAWRQHPATKKFRAFLREWQSHLAERWAAGCEMEPMAQAYAQILGDLERMPFAALAERYEAIDAFREEQQELANPRNEEETDDEEPQRDHAD